jgi:ABC-type uncharacterized transport system substrate-binding protein
MAVAVQQIYPVAHLPLILGVFRRLEVATVIDRLLPPHPAHVLSCGHGVEALVLAILDGDHALYKVGQRLEERGMLALLQPGLTRASLHDYRLGHILDALFAANLNKVFSAIALKALEVYAIPTPWLHQDTTTIPIVMLAVGDPVRTGIVASLAQPGGNVTGSTILGAELSAKRLQLLHEALPTLARVAFLWNPANIANRLHFDDIAQGAKALGVTLHSVEVHHPDGFDRALTALSAERPDTLIMTADPLHQRHVGQVIAFAAQHRLPVLYQLRENVEAGGLMSYGASQPALFRRGALYVDKILKGAKPADLPVEQPMQFELVINLKTAEALGLTIPPMLLFQADAVIR